MTLRPCYRATCDAPGCLSDVFLVTDRTGACRDELARSGWFVLPWRVRSDAPGAPRLAYLCPEHHDTRPIGWRDARAAAIKTRSRPRAISLDGVEAPTVHLDAARRALVAWIEPWAKRLRAAGAIP